MEHNPWHTANCYLLPVDFVRGQIRFFVSFHLSDDWRLHAG